MILRSHKQTGNDFGPVLEWESVIAGVNRPFFVLYNPTMAQDRSLETFLTLLRQQKGMLAQRYGVESLEIFGSYARGEQKPTSDLDLLVTFREAPSLLTFIRMENDLSDALGVRVDLVMKDSLKPGIGRNVLREVVAV